MQVLQQQYVLKVDGEWEMLTMHGNLFIHDHAMGVQ
jgi:hypothetical protein